MPQIKKPDLNYREKLAIGVSPGTGRSSDILNAAALNSFQELQIGVDPVSNLLYWVGISTLRSVYAGFPGHFFTVIGLKEVIHEEVLPVLAALFKLSTWPEGWNGYDALAPNHEAIRYATRWIALFYGEIADLHMDWFEPNVTASAEGEVVFEWRHNAKNLTIYIGSQNAEYLRDWGADMDIEMDDGDANTPGVRRDLWQWLVS